MYPGPKKKFSLTFIPGTCTHRSPPSTFLLLLPNVKKIAQMARCFRKSFHRVLDEDLAARFLIPLTKRLISDHDQLNPFCAFFWKGWSLSGTGLVRELPDLCAEHFWIFFFSARPLFCTPTIFFFYFCLGRSHGIIFFSWLGLCVVPLLPVCCTPTIIFFFISPGQQHKNYFFSWPGLCVVPLL